MLQFDPQLPITNKENENLSENGILFCKKPRIHEIAAPVTQIPAKTNYGMRSNYKTQLCPKFKSGYCSYGGKCTFAHGNSELRKRLPNFEVPVCKEDGLARTRTAACKLGDKSNLCKMFYYRKGCPNGYSCRFVHVSPENFKGGLVYHRKSSAVRIGNAGISDSHGSGFESSKPLCKNRLCNNWEMRGICFYGETCRFAHGQAELQKSAGYIELASGFVPLPTKSSETFPIKGKKCSFKRKALKKINGIYADWIEDIRPFRITQ